MGLQLPGELRGLLSMLGFNWPAADEEKLFEMAQTWMNQANTIRSHVDDATNAAAQVWKGNTADTVAAFQAAWEAADSPAERLKLAATGAQIIGAGLMVIAGVVLALKIAVIAQLVACAIQIAAAIAAAAATFGASLAQIPIAKMLAKYAIDIAIDKAVTAVLNG